MAQFAAVPGLAPAEPGAPSTEVRWHTAAQAVAPGGTLWVALELRHPEGWHSYYRNTGGPEQPLAIRWQLPPGWTAGEIRWPTPAVKDGFFGKSFIYEGAAIFTVPIHVAAAAQVGSEFRLQAEASWQICRDGCISEESSFDGSVRVLPQVDGGAEVPLVFARAEQALPRPLPDGWQVRARRDDASSTVCMTIQMPEAAQWTPADFVPAVPFLTSMTAGGKLERTPDGWELRLPLVRESALGQPVAVGSSVSGVVLGQPAYEILPVEFSSPASGASAAAGPAGADAASRAGEQDAVGFAALPAVLGGMFLGGLILNLMPCVFPVIGLKVMGFVQQAGGDRRKVMMHGWMFAIGVWASFALIAGGLWALRGGSGDQAPSWGYQLQDARVVYGLLVLMWLLGLNMAGLFEIGVSATSAGGRLQQQGGLVGTFFSGVLATVVATPCSAPYLGSAMAVAVGLPPLGYALAFGAMATGLALPYLVLSWFPRLLDFLPRPGPWMERFKQGMSFLLFATSGFLLWVYAGQIGLDALLLPLFALVLIAMAAWIYGNWGLPHHTRRVRAVACSMGMALAAMGFWLGFPAPVRPAVQQLETEVQWREWSADAVERELAAGNPVYVDFTAKWCATCQVNKRRAYPVEVVRLMREKGVVAFRADKTKPHAEIDAAIEKLGRVAIPVNTLQAPGQPVHILPELLSADDVAGALRLLPDRSGKP